MRISLALAYVTFLALGVALGVQASRPSPNACPKVLMFDGLGYRPEAYSETNAKYWGMTVGVQGFFMNYVMGGWGDSVGDEESGPLYLHVKQFQETFSKYGVTDNFIKVASRLSLDWSNPEAQSRVISNFRQAAHLARFAGLKGLAIDIEPQVKGLWAEDPQIPDKAERVFAFGRRVGDAIRSEFPDAVVIVLPEVLMYTCPPYPPETCQSYALSSQFWDGLVQAHFKELIIATENSYNSRWPNLIAQNVRDKYHGSLLKNGLEPDSVPVAMGLWPLGKSYSDKSPRITPSQFEDRLGLAFQEARREGSPYVWIYGLGSAWEKDGPYGKGDVTPNFEEYVQVLRQMKESCSKSNGK